MKQYNLTHFAHSASYAVLASVAVLSMLFAGFFLAEPAVSRGQADTSTFYIRQEITDETSFTTEPTNVDMTGPGNQINGVTGGQATGTTQFVVTSNNAAGYYVTIGFEYTSNDEAMVGDESSSQAIRDYGGSDMQPSYGYTASSAAQFAYTVTSSSSNHTDASFLNNGSACGTGGSNQWPTGAHCWMAPSSTVAYQIVDTSSAAITGATSTLTFNVTVPSGATPVPQAETYTATATLSLYVK